MKENSQIIFCTIFVPKIFITYVAKMLVFLSFHGFRSPGGGGAPRPAETSFLIRECFNRHLEFNFVEFFCPSVIEASSLNP